MSWAVFDKKMVPFFCTFASVIYSTCMQFCKIELSRLVVSMRGEERRGGGAIGQQQAEVRRHHRCITCSPFSSSSVQFAVVADYSYVLRERGAAACFKICSLERSCVRVVAELLAKEE